MTTHDDETSFCAARAQTLDHMADAARHHYEVASLRAMAQSWRLCASMPSLNAIRQAGSDAEGAALRAEREHAVRCADMALRDSQTFATLHLADGRR